MNAVFTWNPVFIEIEEILSYMKVLNTIKDTDRDSPLVIVRLVDDPIIHAYSSIRLQAVQPMLQGQYALV